MENRAESRELFISIIEQQSGNSRISGRYFHVTRIDPNAGEGHFSLVFKADDALTGKRVALKFFNPLENDEYRRQCFNRECSILELLQGQPNILQLVESKAQYTIEMTHQPTGICWPLTLEFIATELAKSNIKHYIYKTEIEPRKSLLYFREMCKGIQRIHTKQIRHRDVKPDNFFLVGRDDVCLGDLGTSRLFGENIRPLVEEYHAGFWRGDIFYTAPEMFGYASENAELFRRADIYSLGAILFEMFTRQKLYPFVFDERFSIQLIRMQKYGLSGLPLIGQNLAQIAAQIVRHGPLPDIYDFDNDVPRVISDRLNRLYKGLANLDHSQRLCDFAVVFREIDRCINILQNQRQYERLIELRRLWQSRRKEHIQRRKALC